MRAAIQHVQHRRRQNAGVDAAEVAIERNLKRLRNGARGGHRNGQDRVGAQLAFVRRAIERNHGLVDQPLIGGIHAFELGSDHGLNVGYCLQHALAQVVALVAVAQFHGFVLAGRSARGHNGAAQLRRFPESRLLLRWDCRANPELRAREWQQSQSYQSSQCGAAAGHSVWDGDPRQELLRRRSELFSEALAGSQIFLPSSVKGISVPSIYTCATIRERFARKEFGVGDQCWKCWKMQ